MSKNIHRPFVGRAEALCQFKKLLQSKDHLSFINFYGHSGMGKSFLINHLIESHIKGWEHTLHNFEPGLLCMDYEVILDDFMRVITAKSKNRKCLESFEAVKREINKCPFEPF